MTKITNTTNTASTSTTTSTTKLDWCNLDNYEISVEQRLNSSKDIIVVDEIDDNTYEKSKSVCENICGRLFLPSTLKENYEVQSVIDRRVNCYIDGHYKIGYIWLRMAYNETLGTWYDPDNKEDLTFLNFHPYDEIRDCTVNRNCVTENTKEHHAVMYHDGEWWSRAGDNKYSDYVFCELT